MKLCFVSVNGPRETYFVDEPRIIDLFDQVLVLFSPCKYKAIYRSSLRAFSFLSFSLSNMLKAVQFGIL
jgi:hypothetical protein